MPNEFQKGIAKQDIENGLKKNQQVNRDAFERFRQFYDTLMDYLDGEGDETLSQEIRFRLEEDLRLFWPEFITLGEAVDIKLEKKLYLELLIQDDPNSLQDRIIDILRKKRQLDFVDIVLNSEYEVRKLMSKCSNCKDDLGRMKERLSRLFPAEKTSNKSENTIDKQKQVEGGQDEAIDVQQATKRSRVTQSEKIQRDSRIRQYAMEYDSTYNTKPTVKDVAKLLGYSEKMIYDSSAYRDGLFHKAGIKRNLESTAGIHTKNNELELQKLIEEQKEDDDEIALRKLKKRF